MKYIVTFVLSSIFSFQVLATPVGPMSYQGRLLDDNGIPVTGAYDFKVNIHNDPSAVGLQYAEKHSNVQVYDGVYSLKIGTQTPTTGTWDVNLWQGNLNDLYLELEVSVYNAGAYETLTPRHELTSAPHAFTATLALSAETLGAKTATEFDNILEGICVSSKGKWLDKVQKCLGAGSDFGVTAVGGSMVSIATLTMSAIDFKNLDLTGADISGIDFYSANFSNTNMTDVTLSIIGIDTATLTGVYMDNVTAIDSGAISGNLSNAVIVNSNLSSWDISSANLTNLSAGMLSGCPTIPAGGTYRCDSWSYRSVIGPNMNYSASSAFANKFNKTYIPQNSYQFANGVSYLNADFSGNKIRSISWSTDPGGHVFTNANFDFSDIRNVRFGGEMSGATFKHANISDTEFTHVVFSAATSFEGANLSYVSIGGAADGSTFTFKDTTINGMYMQDSVVAGYGANLSLTFDNTSVSNASLTPESFATLTFINSKVYGGLYIGSPISSVSFPSGFTRFIGGNINGDWSSAVFNGRAKFINVSLQGLDLTSATGLYASSFKNVNWYGATCPNGVTITTIDGTCIGNGI